jgi:hypothetical protein
VAKLTDAQIAAAAKSAGFSGDALVVAVAVALAESSGDPRAHNPIGLDDSYGLWQINMLGDMGPARRRQFGLTSNQQLFDPVTNAKAAYAISSGGKNWRPWSTYTNLAYRTFMNRARLAAGAPAASVPGGSAVPVSAGGGGVVQVDFTPGSTGAVQVDLGWNDLADPFGLIPDGEGGTLGGGLVGGSLVKMFMQWTAALVKGAAWLGDSDNWVRIAQVLAGAGLLVTGVSIMGKPLAAPVVGAAQTVASVTPVGKIGKVAKAA